MNRTYIFSKENNREYLFYVAVIPLLLYGIYKNGYLLIANNYIDKMTLLRILSYPIISSLIGFILSKIFKRKSKELIRFGVLAGLTAPFDFNIIAYFSIVIGAMFLVMYVPNRLKINEISLLITLLIILNYIFNNSVLFNPMELTSMYKFTLLDLFFGRGVSFIYTSSVFWLLVSYIILLFIRTYKRNIFLYEIATYIGCFIIFVLFKHHFVDNFSLFLNGITFFSFIFLSPINESSPSTNIEMIIFSIITALITFILVFVFKIVTGAIFAVLISSIIYRLYDLIRQKKFL